MRGVTREESFIMALVEMADTLVGDFDVIELLTSLTDRCVNLLGVSAAGVMLTSPEGDLRPVASSTEAMRLLELLELQAQRGPCLDAFRTGGRVEHENLEGEAGRWPQFATAAVEAGFRSVLAVPLRLRDTTIGALTLLNVEQQPMSEADVIVAQAFADLATISILQHRAATEHQRVNEQLTQALSSRVVIEQAKGVIAERAGIDITEAFARLRLHARNNNLRLTEVAQTAVDGTLDAPGMGRRAPVDPSLT
jgi:GAF domain-containing protein